jgi:hypothetical protein
MQINHIGKNADTKLIANEISYDFQTRLSRIAPWVGVAFLLAGIAVLLYIGFHPVP